MYWKNFLGKKNFQIKVVLMGAQFLVVQLVSMVLQLSLLSYFLRVFHEAISRD